MSLPLKRLVSRLQRFDGQVLATGIKTLLIIGRPRDAINRIVRLDER